MKTFAVGNKQFSQMSLGTVQLGMFYGIANNAGKPSLETSFSILRTAIEGGVTALDTAAGYGESEKVIGQFFKENGGSKDLFITTKFKLKAPTDAPAAQVKAEIRESVENSLTNLGIQQADCLLLHTASDIVNYGDVVAETLRDLKEEGLIARSGVSIYAPTDLEGALRYPDVISMVQAPMNLFDHALSESSYMAELRKRNIALIIRSVFLQGLFFLDPDNLAEPDLVEPAADKLRLIRSIAEEEGISLSALAISYIRDNPDVTGIVLGADNAQQVQQNLAYFAPDAPVISDRVRKLIDEKCSADIPAIMKVLSRPRS